MADTLQEVEQIKEENKMMRIIFRIALEIKAGRLPESFSKKGTELAGKFEGEELEKIAFGG